MSRHDEVRVNSSYDVFVKGEWQVATVVAAYPWGYTVYFHKSKVTRNFVGRELHCAPPNSRSTVHVGQKFELSGSVEPGLYVVTAIGREGFKVHKENQAQEQLIPWTSIFAKPKKPSQSPAHPSPKQAFLDLSNDDSDKSKGSETKSDSHEADTDHSSAEPSPNPESAPQPSSYDAELYEMLLCPISKELMTDPVMTADGQTYDRKSIEKWFQKHNTSPMTNLPLPNKNLQPNYFVRRMLELYHEHQKAQQQQKPQPQQQQQQNQ